MDQAIGQFFRGRLVIEFIMGVLLSAGWFLAGVPYWFFLGMVTGLLNVVPYFIDRDLADRGSPEVC